MAVAQAKEGIEKELTCPLCLDIFQDPKRLPCDHIYCKDPCIQGLVLRSQNATITCPECRTVVQVPHSDVNNLPTAFQINRLKELYDKMKENDETDSPSTPVKDKEQATCATHVSQPIALYCETCEETLCRDCVLKSEIHKKHDYGYIDEVADKQRKQIASQLKPARELESKLSTALENISQVKENIATRGQAHLDRIEVTFNAIVNALREEKELLKSNVSEEIQQKSNKLTCQEEELTTHLSELSSRINKAESSIQTKSDEEFVHNKGKLMKQIQEVCHEAQGMSLQPKEAADLGLCLTSPDKIRASYKKENYTYTLADPQECVLENFGVLETSRSTLTVLSLKGFANKKITNRQDIQVELLCIRDNSVVYGEVSCSTTTDKQLVTVTPLKRGRHNISVKVNNFHIAGSPFSVYVHKPPLQLTTPVATKEYPAVALFSFENKLYVTCDYKNMVVFNTNMEITQTYELDGVNEMAIDSETEDWLVTDVKHNRLHKLDKHRRLVKSVGDFGTQPEQFNLPNGLQININGKVFVCDSKNHRIKVYNRELELLRIIGKKGEKPGCFNAPDNLAIDESGNVFVTEQYNHRVQVISPDGKTIRTFGKRGSKPGQLYDPVGIAINGQYVYISDQANARVSVFTTQGQFVTTFGNGYLRNPECIAIDRDGYIYISDSRQRIIVF